ncbi:MAG: LCP family protein [Ileibacterium sp.]|nr:LCP family protein [Ileibacterium sp.]
MSKSSSKSFTAVKLLLSVLIVLLSVLLGFQIMRLNVLPTPVLIPVLAGLGLVDLLVIVLLLFFTKKTTSRVLCSILAVVLALVYGGGSFYLFRTQNALGALTADNAKVKNVVRVYALNDSGIDDEKGLEGKKVGILKSINKAGSEKTLNALSEAGVKVESEEFNNFGPLADALYTDKVDAIVVNDVYLSNITELSKFTDFTSKTKVVFTYEYTTEMSSASSKVTNITTEPFTVMINGSDSREGLGNTDRSDVNMLATINPKTGVVLLVSIPRDAYVETACDPEYECLNGQYDKLTHTGIHTYNTTKATIEKLMDVKINYTFRANFAAVVDIVDALGGIDVNVKPGYAVESFWTNDMFGTDYGVTEGVNHLNGQAALCYARERYAYAEGDFQRIRNQQEVLTQIAKKVTSPEVITRYAGLLDTIAGNFWTDISQAQISELIQYQINKAPKWDFISYSLSGQPDSLYCAEAYNNASVVVLDQNTVKFAKELIQAVLDGKSAEEINKLIKEKVPEAADYSLDASVQNHDPVYDEGIDEYQMVEEPAPIYTPYYPTYEEPYTPTPTPEPSVDPTPITPEPVNPEPVNPEPVNPEPVNPDPVNPEPVNPDPVNPEPVNPEPVNPDPGSAQSVSDKA